MAKVSSIDKNKRRKKYKLILFDKFLIYFFWLSFQDYLPIVLLYNWDIMFRILNMAEM